MPPARRPVDETQEIVVIQQDRFEAFKNSIETKLAKLEKFVDEETERKLKEAPEVPLLKARVEALEKRVTDLEGNNTWVIRIILGINIGAVIGLILKP